MEAGARDEPCRVPGRARGEGMLLYEQDVGHSQLGEVIGDRATDHATPHDDDLGPGGQRVHFSSCVECILA